MRRCGNTVNRARPVESVDAGHRAER